MDSPRTVFERKLRQLAMNRLLADGQRQYQAPAYPKRRGKATAASHVTFDLMRYLLGFLVSTALLFASGELSGRRAPGFSLPDLQGQQHDLQDYRGKVVVIDIIQTTCPHCARLTDVLKTVEAKYGDRIAILSFAVPPDTQATVARFVAAHQVSTPVLFDCGQVSASYLQATPKNPTVSVPHLFLVDGQGTIRNDFGYDFNTRNIFEGDGLFLEIDRLLGASAPAKGKK
jgi:peroxiredoxin